MYAGREPVYPAAMIRVDAVALQSDLAREQLQVLQQRRQDEARKPQRVQPTQETGSSQVNDRRTGQRLNTRA